MSTGFDSTAGLGSLSQFDSSTVVSITVFCSLICFCIVIGRSFGKNRWANESITSLLLGLVSGAVALLISKGQSSRILKFNEELFFIYLLPPIIFNAGFQVKRKHFFKNFSTILMFAVLGTIISFCLISAGMVLLLKRVGVTQLDLKDYLALGAILSATDSVCTLQVLNQNDTPFLFSIIFGEGVGNDATSIVLFNAVQSLDLSKLSAKTAITLLGTFLYLFLCSTILGILVGLLSAYIIKKLFAARDSTDSEIALMVLMAYVSYMIAELMNLSGILTVFFCGIVMSHYTWHNVSDSAKITAKHAFATMSFISETFMFLYVGMDALDIDKWKESGPRPGTFLAVSSIMLALVCLGRAAFVFPLASILNYINRKEHRPIEFHKQFIIWWAGLMRGAVTLALSYNAFSGSGGTTSNEKSLMIACTIIVVLFSTLVFGAVTKHLTKAVLGAPRETGSDGSIIHPLLRNGGLSNNANEGALDAARICGLLMEYPTSVVHQIWREFDDTFMRPFFGGQALVQNGPASSTGASNSDPKRVLGAENEPVTPPGASHSSTVFSFVP